MKLDLLLNLMGTQNFYKIIESKIFKNSKRYLHFFLNNFFRIEQMETKFIKFCCESTQLMVSGLNKSLI